MHYIYVNLYYYSKSNIKIANILYDLKYIYKKNIGTIYGVLLVHEVQGRRIILDTLLYALGINKQHIERYEAKFIDKKMNIESINILIEIKRINKYHYLI